MIKKVLNFLIILFAAACISAGITVLLSHNDFSVVQKGIIYAILSALFVIVGSICQKYSLQIAKAFYLVSSYTIIAMTFFFVDAMKLVSDNLYTFHLSLFNNLYTFLLSLFIGGTIMYVLYRLLKKNVFYLTSAITWLIMIPVTVFRFFFVPDATLSALFCLGIPVFFGVLIIFLMTLSKHHENTDIGDISITASTYQRLLSIISATFLLHTFVLIRFFGDMQSQFIDLPNIPSLFLRYDSIALFIAFFAIIGFFATGIIRQKKWIMIASTILSILFFWRLYIKLSTYFPNLWIILLITVGITILVMLQQGTFEKILNKIRTYNIK